MTYKILTCCLLIFLQKDLNAQSVKIGLEAGVGMSNTLTELGKTTFVFVNSVNNYRFATRSGLVFHADVGKKSIFQSGLYYAAKGNKNIVQGGFTFSYNSIELPITFVYKTSKHSKINFWIGGGGYLAYAINAKVNYIDLQSKEVSEKAKFGSIKYIDDLKRFEYGLQIQNGLSFNNGMFIRLIAQRQLNNLAPNKMIDLSVQYPPSFRLKASIETLRSEFYTSLTVGYLIGLKKTNKPINI